MKTLRSYSLFSLAAAALLCLAAPLSAQVPNLVSYQGRVSVGLTNFQGTGQFKFALVNTAGSTAYWRNSADTAPADGVPDAAVSLPVTKGLYSVLLGDPALTNMAAIPASVWTNADVRLRIWFNDGANGFQLLTPDQRLAPAGYLPDAAVTTAKLADGSVSSAKIASAAVGSTHIAPGAVGSGQLAQGAVGYAHIVTDAIGEKHIASNAVGSSEIADGSITTADLGPGIGLWDRSGTNIFYTAGNAGLGSSTPLAKFEIQGGADTDGTNDPKALAFAFSGGGFRHFIRSRHHANNTGNGLDFFLNNQVTAGDSTAPGIGNGLIMTLENGGVRLSDNMELYLRSGTDLNHGLAWYGTGRSFGPGPGGEVDGPVLYGWNGGALGSTGSGKSVALRWDNNGRVGVGVSDPGAALDVGITSTRRLRMRVDGNDIPVIEAVSSDTGDSLAGIMRMRHAVEIWPNAAGNRAGKLDIRNTAGDPVITLDGASGETTVKVLKITGGADIAEPFLMSGETIPKGAVVVIDELNPGKLRLSDRAYDTKVAGIVSGANGINPGLALHQEGVIEGGQNVALTGRVHAMAEATDDSIKPGDLLTTSETPGHLMKASDRERRDGAIIGKAMSSLESGKGFVLVLVNLQ